MRRRNIRNSTRLALAFATGLFALAAALPPSAPAVAAEASTTLRGDPATEAAERERLFAALAAAPNAAEAESLASQVWMLWFRAPNEAAAALMTQARDRSSVGDFTAAAELFDKLVATEPGWAEAWNQRATLRYMMNNFDGSLDDIDRVLALEPKHFGALSGQALILMHQGRMEAGQSALRKAVEIDPFLSERALLIGPPGQDI